MLLILHHSNPEDIDNKVSRQKKNGNDIYKNITQTFERDLILAQKSGYVQGICECAVCIGNYKNYGKKLLSEMNITKDMAKQFANHETYESLEQGVFA